MRPFIGEAVTAFALAVLFVSTGCLGKTDSYSASVSFVTDYTPVSFSFPAGWEKGTGKHPFELKAVSPDRDKVTGVFVFKSTEFGERTTPHDVLVAQIEDMLSKRQNVKELGDIEETAYPDKTVTSVSYLADKGSSRNHYQFSLIEFADDDSRFVVMLQVAGLEDWGSSQAVFERIRKSAKPMPRQSR